MSDGIASAMGEDDIRPVVPLARQGNWGLIAFGAVLLIGGASLFAALNANRAELEVPRTVATLGEEGTRISAPPPLALPPEYLGPAMPPPDSQPGRADLLPPVGAAPARPQPPATMHQIAPAPAMPFPPPEPPVGRPPVVFEAPFSPGYPSGGAPQSEGSTERVTAGRLTNPSHTVPRGTVIPAVLETALDSTRPGAARGLVQRDVHSFDGTRVLIPRGSRLYGEYVSDLASGQNRAMITWTRLLRPDGVTINLDSPASDPLGRAGIKGKVDSKFFERFGGAILQSVLDIGVGIATREATNGVIVALPGSTQNVRVTDPQTIQPTLKVRQGTSVSVFVARDLDFSTVDP